MKVGKKDKRTKLEVEIDRLLEDMSTDVDQTSLDYLAKVEVLEKLEALENKRNGSKKERNKLDPNIVLGHVVETCLAFAIMNFEKVGVITTKAFGRLWRPRL